MGYMLFDLGKLNHQDRGRIRDVIRDNFIFIKEEEIVGFSEIFGKFLHQGITRLTGEPYKEHLRMVAEGIDSILKNSDYKDQAIAAGWLHDGPEDVDVLSIFNPFSPPRYSELDPEKVYLNHLMENANQNGNYLNFIVESMTKDPEMIYADYMMKKFRFDGTGVIHDLQIISAIVKMVDRNSNGQHPENFVIDDMVTDYMKLKHASEKDLVEFYKKFKIIDKYRERGDASYNIAFFVKSLTDRFEEKRRGNALDNLTFYVPLAEQHLVAPFLEAGHELYHVDRLRQTLVNTFKNAFDILGSNPQLIHDLRKSGFHRSVEDREGYLSIRKELRGELYPKLPCELVHPSN